MKSIPDEYRKDKYTFTLIKRNKLFAIYRQHKAGASDGFEVVKIRTHKKDRAIAGKTVFFAGDEYLPCNEDWGTYGWTYPDCEKACSKFDVLTHASEDSSAMRTKSVPEVI